MLKVAKVIGRWPEVARRQNNGADGEAGRSEKKWRRAVAGQSMEPGMLERGMMRRLLVLLLPDGYAMLMRHNKTETAIHGCHGPGDMAVRMR